MSPAPDKSKRAKRAFARCILAIIPIAWVAAALFFPAGCCLLQKFPPIDTSQPGWRVQQSEALWTPRRGIPELAGELVFAAHPDGRSFIQFTKGNLSVVTAQSSTNRWRIEFPPRKLCFAGKGSPPSRFGWLQLPRALRGEALPSPWRLIQKESGPWRLENIKTGETLEGILSP